MREKRAKYARSGMKVGRNREGGQTHTGDGSSATKIRFTCLGKTQRGSCTIAKTNEGAETSRHLFYGILQWFGVWVRIMGPRKIGF